MDFASKTQDKRQINVSSTKPIRFQNEDVEQGDLIPFVVGILLPLVSELLWGLSLKDVHLESMNGLGLVSVLPPLFYLALGILFVSFCLVLHWKQTDTPILLFHFVILILILNATHVIPSDVTKGPVPWRHAGITQYLMNGGELNGRLEFYFNFPGFFFISALLTSVAGFQSPISFMGWAPVFFNLLYLAPLFMILRSATANKQVLALSIWFFYLANWVDQDNFVPQALGFFLYLIILAILLTWFKSRGEKPSGILRFAWRWITLRVPFLNKYTANLVPTERENQASLPAQRASLIAILATLFLLMVSSHPLSPGFLFLTLMALVVFNRIKPRSLPVLLVVLFAVWLSYMGVAYIRSTHAHSAVTEVGNLAESINENVTSRVRGDLAHTFIVISRIAFSGVVWSLAFFGGIRSLRKGDWYPVYALMAVVPFITLILQPYGGEMLLRVFLFSLPAVSFFAALFFFPEGQGPSSWKSSALIGLVSVVLFGGLVIARFGSEKINHFTVDEVKAVQFVYDQSEPGSLLVAPVYNLPWKFRDINQYFYRNLPGRAQEGDIEAYVSYMTNKKFTRAYLILTRSQKNYAESYLGWAPGTWENFENEIINSKKFTLLYSNPDAEVFVLNRD